MMVKWKSLGSKNPFVLSLSKDERILVVAMNNSCFRLRLTSPDMGLAKGKCASSNGLVT